MYAGISRNGSHGKLQGSAKSGPLFYFLHIVIYGRPWFLFHYALAGWILAWAFIRCQNVWTPMILHALGNVLMGTGQALLLFAPGLARWLVGQDL